MILRVWIDDWEITDRLLDSGTFLRYGFDEKLQDFKQDVSALPFYDADGQLEQYIRNNPNAILKIQDDNGFYFEGVIEQEISKEAGKIELRVQNLSFSSYKLSEKITSAGIYTLKQALLKIFPNSVDIDDVKFNPLGNEKYATPTMFWSWNAFRNTKGANLDDPITGLIFDDTSYFALAGTDNIFICHDNNGTVEIINHFYLPDIFGARGWKVRLLGGSSPDDLRFVAYNGLELRFTTYDGTGFSWITADTVYHYSFVLQSIDAVTTKFYMKQAYKTAIWSRSRGYFYYATFEPHSPYGRLVVVKVGSGPLNNDGTSILSESFNCLNAGTIAYRYSESKTYYVLGCDKNDVFFVYDLDNPPDSITPATGFRLVQNSVQRVKGGEDGYVLAIRNNNVLTLVNPFNTSNYEDLISNIKGDIKTAGSTTLNEADISVNVEIETETGWRNDMQERAVIYTNRYGVSGVMKYQTGLKTDKPLVEYLFNFESNPVFNGLVVAGNYYVPILGASITSEYYPNVVITYANKNDNLGNLIKEITQLGFYAIQFVNNTQVKAKSLYYTDFNSYFEIKDSDYKIIRHNILLPYKYASMNPAYVRVGFKEVEGTAKTGFSIDLGTTYSCDLSLTKFASEFLNLMKQTPSTIWIETTKKLNIGDVIRIKTANGFVNTGIIVAVERSMTYKYLILSNITIPSDNQYPENPTPSVPIVNLDIVETQKNFTNAYGLLVFHVKGTNTGGMITKIKVHVVENYQGIRYNDYEFDVIFDKDFNVHIPYFTSAHAYVFWTMEFCNDGGCATRRAYGHYNADTPPQLDLVLAKDGQVLPTGSNKSNLYPSIVPNSLMQDDDGDGYIEGWYEYDFNTHTVGNAIAANTTYQIIGNACGYIENNGMPEKFWVSERVPFNSFWAGSIVKKWNWAYDILDTGGDLNDKLKFGLLFYDKDNNYLDSVKLGEIGLYNEGAGNLYYNNVATNVNTPGGTRYARVYLKIYSTDGANCYAYAYIQGFWIRPALDQYDFYLDNPLESYQPATKNYVDTRDPYAHEVTDLPPCDAINYGRIVIRQWDDGTLKHNTVYICKKTGDATYEWKQIVDDTWTKL